MKAIRMHRPGGPEVLELEEVETPSPGPGEVLIRASAAGVNYADVGLRRGMMGGPHAMPLPATPGFEVVGVVEALGEGVSAPPVGARVAAVLDAGGYAEYAVAPAEAAVPIPEGVDDAAATALLVQGLTAYGVLHDSARIQPGESVLVQSAAGGVGSLAVQLARLAGANPVIGAASGGKLGLVSELGAHAAVDYTRDGWAGEVYGATGGRGVDVVLEAVGGRVGAEAFGALAPLGRMVLYGGVSGEPLPLTELQMMPMSVKGLAVLGYGGPWLRPGRAEAAREAILGHLRAGELRVPVGGSFPLADAAEAHRAIEERRTTGKVLLTV